MKEPLHIVAGVFIIRVTQTNAQETAGGREKTLDLCAHKKKSV